MKHDYSIQPVNKDVYRVHKWDGGDMPIATYIVVCNPFKCNCMSGRYRKYCEHTNMVKKYRVQERKSEGIEPIVMFFQKESK